MNETRPLFELDSSIWCVSGYNAFSFDHTSKNGSVLYRGNSQPELGWMMPRSIIEEILPIWPSINIVIEHIIN